jgi:6-phosphogluconolactonase
MRRRLLFLGAMAGLTGAAIAARSRTRRPAGRIPFFIGTQGDGVGQGIFAAEIDERTGELSPFGLQAEVARPTWIHADARRPVLFAVSELGNAGDRDGEILSFAIRGHSLAPIGRTGSGGGGATHLDLDREGRTLFVANFAGGAAAIPVAPDGTLASPTSIVATSGSGPHRRQAGPHPHGVTLAPGGHFLLVPDMGADRIFVYRFDAKAKSLEADDALTVMLPAGSGPRLVSFGRDGCHAYLLTELSAELFTFRWDARSGRLTLADSVALDEPGIVEGRSAAVLVRSEDGRFLYASNRRTNAIQVYAIARRTGSLRHIQSIAAGGSKPWGAAIAPGGRWLVVANQGDDLVRAFGIDRRSGRLTAGGGSLAIPAPTGIAFTG